MATGPAIVTIPKELSDLGFEAPRVNITPRINALAGALPRCGKTHLGCTMPGPIAYISHDDSTRGVIEKHVLGGKQIMLLEFKPKERWMNGLQRDSKLAPQDQQTYKLLWDHIQRAWTGVLKNPNVKSIVVDKLSDWWSYARLAEWGAASVGQRQFGPMNNMFLDMIGAARNTDKNVLFLTNMKKVYTKTPGSDKGDWNGEYEMAGPSDMEYAIENVIELTRDDEGDFVMDVVNSRANFELFRGKENSRVVGAADVNFDTLAHMIYPKVKMTHWEDDD